MGKYVRGNERKPIARPQPPHLDRRTKRSRTRASQELEELEGQIDDLDTPSTEEEDGYWSDLAGEDDVYDQDEWKRIPTLNLFMIIYRGV